MLRVALTDLDGNVFGYFPTFESAEVTIPLNDSRTARITVSMFDRLAAKIEPLRTMLKFWFYDELVFWGVVLVPTWQGQAGTVDVTAHDMTIKWKKCFHRFGDIVVDLGYTADGRGMNLLAASAIPSQEQLDRGVRHSGIVAGYDSTPLSSNLVKVDRGTNVFESITNLASGQASPDFNVRPIDHDHPPTVADHTSGDEIPNPDGYTTGTYAQLDTIQDIGEDKDELLIFHFRWGRENLSDFTYEPSGDSVVNYAVVVNPGGEKNVHDVKNKALSANEDGWEDIGIYQSWESAGSEYTKETLQDKANQTVRFYHESPEYFTMTPVRDGMPYAYRYGRDYMVGDRVRAIAKLGELTKDVKGRITSVTLAADKLIGVSTTMTCVPRFDITPTEETN
jgi:hypothetical protein